MYCKNAENYLNYSNISDRTSPKIPFKLKCVVQVWDLEKSGALLWVTFGRFQPLVF